VSIECECECDTKSKFDAGEDGQEDDDVAYSQLLENQASAETTDCAV
jgi:hypothetical protein